MSIPTAPESGGGEKRDALVLRIQAKRAEVEKYLSAASSRNRRLVNVTIVAGTIAAATTAGPALGGKNFADWLTGAFSLSTPSWRILCLVAFLCSLAATVATQLQTSHDYEDRIARAQGTRASLEALEVGIASGYLSQQEAMSQYLKCVDSSSFIDVAR
jgi:MFS family permease